MVGQNAKTNTFIVYLYDAYALGNSGLAFPLVSPGGALMRERIEMEALRLPHCGGENRVVRPRSLQSRSGGRRADPK